jgi:hypothetical protein
MTPITDKIKQLPDGVNVWTNICDPVDGKWKTNVQAFDSTDLKAIVSDLEVKKRALEKYDELIMAVVNKYPNETRHETALRYIRERENPSSSMAGAKIEPIR